MMKIKVPFLKSSDLDYAVCDLLRKYGEWRKKPAKPPIDVDEIVEGYLGLVLEVDDLRQRLGFSDVLGATWFNESRICIDQSLEDKEGRFAFTVAHEIAHWQLHRPIYELGIMTLPLFPSHVGGPAVAAVVCRATEGKAPAEWQADQFAARLLMPTTFVSSAVRALSGKSTPAWDGLDERRKAGVLDTRLQSFADEVLQQGGFQNVSNEAMCYRLLDLKLVKDKSMPELF